MTNFFRLYLLQLYNKASLCSAMIGFGSLFETHIITEHELFVTRSQIDLNLVTITVFHSTDSFSQNDYSQEQREVQ